MQINIGSGIVWPKWYGSIYLYVRANYYDGYETTVIILVVEARVDGSIPEIEQAIIKVPASLDFMRWRKYRCLGVKNYLETLGCKL